MSVVRDLSKIAFLNMAGRLPDASAFPEKLAGWIRFAHWRMSHRPVLLRSRAHLRQDHGARFKLYETIVREESLDRHALTYLEFGVYQGSSISWWVDRIHHQDARFVGFDTFQGLPDGWHPAAPSGTFSTGGQAPSIDDPRCHFEVGLFQETLRPFLHGFSRNGHLVVHLDADLYSSTLFVLTSIGTALKPGDLLFFDEFADPLHEFRAFEDFAKSYRFGYEVLGEVNNFNQVCLRVSSLASIAVNPVPEGAAGLLISGRRSSESQPRVK